MSLADVNVMVKLWVFGLVAGVLVSAIAAVHAQESMFAVIPIDRKSPEVLEIEDAERSFNLGTFAEQNALVPFDDLSTNKVVTDVLRLNCSEARPRSCSAWSEWPPTTRATADLWVIDVPQWFAEALDEPGAEPALEGLAPIMEDLRPQPDGDR